MLLMLQYQTLGIWILRQTTKNTLLPMCCLKRKSKKTSRTSRIVLLFLAQQNSLSMSWLLQRKQGVILQEIPFPCSNSCSHVLDMSTFVISFAEALFLYGRHLSHIRSPWFFLSSKLVARGFQCVPVAISYSCPLGNPIFNWRNDSHV